MDLKNLISRIEVAASLGVEPQTDREVAAAGLFPQPKQCLSDRLILYDREEPILPADKQSLVGAQPIETIQFPEGHCVETGLPSTGVPHLHAASRSHGKPPAH